MKNRNNSITHWLKVNLYMKQGIQYYETTAVFLVQHELMHFSNPLLHATLNCRTLISYMTFQFLGSNYVSTYSLQKMK
jgi:hypothetical protein